MEENILLFLQIHEQNERWFNEHFEELRKGYGSKFFAIKDQRVLVAEEDFEKVLDIIKEKNIDINEVFVASIPPRGVASIL